MMWGVGTEIKFHRDRSEARKVSLPRYPLTMQISLTKIQLDSPPVIATASLVPKRSFVCTTVVLLVQLCSLNLLSQTYSSPWASWFLTGSVANPRIFLGKGWYPERGVHSGPQPHDRYGRGKQLSLQTSYKIAVNRILKHKLPQQFYVYHVPWDTSMVERGTLKQGSYGRTPTPQIR